MQHCHITISRSLSVDIWQLKCQQGQTNFFCKLFRIIKFFFLMLLREATVDSKVAPTNLNSLAFLLHTSKTFFNIELFSNFSQTFLELIFAKQNKNNVVVLPAFKKILRILCVWTLKILLTNKWILT